MVSRLPAIVACLTFTAAGLIAVVAGPGCEKKPEAAKETPKSRAPTTDTQ